MTACDDCGDDGGELGNNSLAIQNVNLELGKLDIYMVNEDDVVTVAPMSMESVLMYKMWVRK